jgi:hypothetical protein
MEPKPYSLACLYTGAVPKIDFDLVAEAVQNDAMLADLSPTIITRLPSKLVSFDFNGQFSVQIVIDTIPLPPETFAIALLGTKATVVENNFARIVEQHRGYIMVTADPEDRPDETPEGRLMRIYALQMVTEFLYRFAKPNLLHSNMAQSLVTPSLNPRSYKGVLDGRIFEQAVLFSRRAIVGSGAPIGANIWGSEELLGRPVSIRLADLPSWAVTAASTSFLDYCDVYGVPEDGETFTNRKGDETYILTHGDPSVNYPNGYYTLTIEHFERANKKDDDGNPILPELLSPEPVVSRKTKAKQNRVSERSPLHSFMILLIGIGITFGLASLAVYWRSYINGGG